MAEEVATTTAPVENIDTSPISAHDDHKSLEDRLARRPEAKDLVDRNILHGTTSSAAVQQRKVELEHAIAADNLKKGLAHRPTREELEERGILPDDHVAPSLLSQKKELEKNMLADGLNTKLARRPTTDEVISKGILNADEDPRSPE